MKNVAWITLFPQKGSLPVLRKKFDLPSRVGNKIKCRIAAVGFYELYLNSRRVGEARLDPTFTRYDVRTGYREYDVTEYLQPGGNCCEIRLGNGWYAGKYSDVYGSQYASYRNISKAALRIFSSHGTILTTSEDWEAAPGAVLDDSPRTGETYDARLAFPQHWQPARRVMPPGGKLFKLVGAPVTLQPPLMPKAVKQEAEHVFCYDFGENLSGTVKLEVCGSAGSRVILRYGEICDENGLFSQDNINWYVDKNTCQTDSYILNGSPAGECWTPSFSYHGYRYVQVTVEGQAEVTGLQALPMRSNFARIGNIDCSDDDFKRLLRAIERSLTSNFTGYPSDCPHREKNAWLADAHIASDSMLVWYDAAVNYREFIDTIFDYQRPNGQLPGMALGSGHGWHWDFGPVWTVAPIFLAYNCYMTAGDMTAIRSHYSKMKKYLDFCLNLRRDNLVDVGPGEWKMPGDDGTVSAGIIDSALICCCLEYMSLFAGLLQKSADAERFALIRTELQQQLANRRLEHVTEKAVMLCCGMGSAADAAELDRIIRQHQCRTDCFGLVGAKFIPRALAEYGYINTAYSMFTQHQYPGWQWMLDHGGTTIWENWQGDESQNHPMMGDAAAWSVRYLAGIKPLAGKFQKFECKPQFPDALNSFKWEYQLDSGVLACAWQRLGDGRIELHLTVPSGSECIYTDRHGKIRTLTGGDYIFS